MPQEIPTPPGEPFAPDPIDPASFSGCGRPLVIGCLGLVVVLGLLSLAFLWKAEEVFSWALGGFEERIEERLPEDLGEAERARLSAAFDGARRAFEEGAIDPEAVQPLQRTLLRLTRDQATLTLEEVEELTSALEGIAGGPAPGDRSALPAPLVAA